MKHVSFILGGLSPTIVLHVHYALTVPADQIASGYPFILAPVGFIVTAAPVALACLVVSLLLSRPTLAASRFLMGLMVFGAMAGSLHLLA